MAADRYTVRDASAHSHCRTFADLDESAHKNAGARLAKACIMQSWSIELPVLMMQNCPTCDPGPTCEDARTLDLAIARAQTDDVFTDEINPSSNSK